MHAYGYGYACGVGWGVHVPVIDIFTYVYIYITRSREQRNHQFPNMKLNHIPEPWEGMDVDDSFGIAIAIKVFARLCQLAPALYRLLPL